MIIKLFKLIFLIVLFAAAGVLSYIFFIEKDIPLNFVEDKVSEISETFDVTSFTTLNDDENFKIKTSYEKYDYDYDENEKSNKILKEKKQVIVAKSGKNEDFTLTFNEIPYEIDGTKVTEGDEKVRKYYIEDNKYYYKENAIFVELAETIWKDRVVNELKEILPLNSSGVLSNKSVFENNIEKVSQIRTIFSFVSKKDDLIITGIYDFIKKKPVSYSEEYLTYSLDRLNSSEYKLYEYCE